MFDNSKLCKEAPSALLKKKMVNVIVTVALFHIVTCWSSDHVPVTEQSQPVNWLCIVIHWSSYITLNYFHVIVDFVYQHLLFFFFHLATLATNLSLETLAFIGSVELSIYHLCIEKRCSQQPSPMSCVGLILINDQLLI